MRWFPFILALMALAACEKHKDKRYVLLGANCDSCLVRTIVEGAQEQFTWNSTTVNYGRTHMVEAGGDVTISAAPLIDSSRWATCVWIKVDDVPSGFEYARPDTAVSLSITVP